MTDQYTLQRIIIVDRICGSSLVNTLDTGQQPVEASITTFEHLYRIGKGQTDVHLRELSLLIGFVDQAWLILWILARSHLKL